MARINSGMATIVRMILVGFISTIAAIPFVQANASSISINSVSEINEHLGDFFGISQKGFSQAPSCLTSGDLVIADGETCSLAADSYIFDSVTVQSGGTLIIQGDTDTNQGVSIQSVSFTVEYNGIVSASQQGYGPGSGPGQGADGSGTIMAGGGGHGGVGGYGENHTESHGFGGTTYGDLYAPISLGSGGGNHNGLSGGAGGGAFKLNVVDLVVDGTISADGGDGQGDDLYAGGGGSGGSIWIEAESLTGNGLITASGGDGHSGRSGGGGGGHIVIDGPFGHYSVDVFIDAYGRGGYQAGGAGTIYWMQEGHLNIHNFWQGSAETLLSDGDYEFDYVAINNAHLRVAGTQSTLTLQNLAGDSLGRLDVECKLYTPSTFTIWGVSVTLYDGLVGVDELNIYANGGLELFANSPSNEDGIFSFHRVAIHSGSYLRLTPHIDSDSGNDYGVTLVTDELYIEEDSLLEANQLGYVPGGGPGKGGDGSDTIMAGGGGHGGMGGYGENHTESHGFGGTTYGDRYAPSSLGSGGGSHNGLSGGAGGGAFKLHVVDMVVNGRISADGGDGHADDLYAGGGGSGGSIWIVTGNMNGSGLITANGGNGHPARSGGGSGGRISIKVVNNDSFDGIIQASGGTGYQAGDAGTVIAMDSCGDSPSDLVIAGGETYSLAASSDSYSFNCVKVQSGGTLIIQGDTDTNQGVSIHAVTFKVEDNGVVSANQAGYSSGSGTGWGADGSDAIMAGGGGHGGMGGHGENHTESHGFGGTTYGDLYAPISLGSGGGSHSGMPGGAGGGAVVLSVSNLVLDGTISANGGDGHVDDSYAGGGGSGGSIWIVAENIKGNGQITANGGDGHSGRSGGGAGGRISIEVVNNSFNGAVQSYGGGGYQAGSAGTIIWKNPGSGYGRLVVDNNGLDGSETHLSSSYYFDSIEINGKAKLRTMGTETSLIILNGKITGDGSGRLDVEGTIESGELEISNVLVRTDYLTTTGYIGTNVLNIGENGTLEMSGSDADVVNILDGGRIRLVSSDNPESIPVLNGTYLYIAEGGILEADLAGYGPGGGPGKGGEGSDTIMAGGGGHGGVGGYGENHSESHGFGGTAYGNIYEPSSLGSGGGSHSGMPGGAGGGAFRLYVVDLVLDGTISANGGNGQAYSLYAGGGGSGGSIGIVAESIEGYGQITANGGDGHSGRSGGGAGGRISIEIVDNSFNGEVQAHGGGGYQAGGAGTIVWKGSGSEYGRLVVDNNGLDGSETHLPDLWEEDDEDPSSYYYFDSIEINGKAKLRTMGTETSLIILDGKITGDGSGRLDIEGYLEIGRLEIGGVLVRTDWLTTTGYTDKDELNITENGVLETQGGDANIVNVLDGGRIRVLSSDNPDISYSSLSLQGVKLYVSEGGFIEANLAGYGPSLGPGRGGDGSGTIMAGGGGHGGMGGHGENHTESHGFGGANSEESFSLGSGGGSHDGMPGGAGGGAFTLEVTDLIVHGTISADGGDGLHDGSGGGAGGSIWIIAENTAGSGLISANGGNGYSNLGGGGAGGRIAIYTEDLASTIEISAQGGSGYQDGEAGTVTLDNVDLSESTVRITPSNPVADGISQATVTVTVISTSGHPLPNREVEIALTYGIELLINNQVVEHGQYVSIGSTDENGQATATLGATTRSGYRNIGVRVEQIPFTQQGWVTFVAGPVSVDNSTIGVNPLVAPADGQTQINVTVIARDEFDNRVRGVPVVLELSESQQVVINHPSPTNYTGVATGSIIGNGLGTIMLGAAIDGNFLPEEKQVEIRFRGSHLELTQSAWAPVDQGQFSATRATAGNPITYTIKVKNTGIMTAGGVTLTDILPNDFEFTSQDSEFPFSQTGQTLEWLLGDIAVGEEIIISLEAMIHQSALGPVVNTVSFTVDEDFIHLEENIENNTSLLTTTVEAPLPALRIVSSSPVLQVQPEATSPGVQVTIQNDGLGSTGQMEASLPTHLSDWVEITPESLASLAPGESTTLTLTANAPAEQPFGQFRGFLEVSDSLGGVATRLVTVRVSPPQRDLVVTVRNGQDILPGARLNLRARTAYTWVTASGVVSIYYPTYWGWAGSDGKITFQNLDEGDYTWHLSAPYHSAASGNLTGVGGEGAQTLDLDLSPVPGLHTSPSSILLVASAGDQDSQPVLLKNTGAAALDNITIELVGLPDWVQLLVPDMLARLEPQEQAEFRVMASPPAGTDSQWLYGNVIIKGTGISPRSLSVEISVLAEADAKRDVRFELTDQDGLPPIPDGTQVIVTRVRPSQMVVDGQTIPYQPQISQQVDLDGNALFTGMQQLEVGEEYTYQAWGNDYLVSEGAFRVNPPEAPGEPQGAQVQSVVLQADHFIYTWKVVEIDDGFDLTYNIEVTITYRDGRPAPRPGWCTPSSECQFEDGTARLGRTPLPENVPPPTMRYSQMKLSQSVVLAWQAFNASLWLKNTSALPLEEMTMQVKVADADGVDRTDDFVIDPAEAVEFDSISPSSEGVSDWLILPKGTGITEPTPFQVYAVIGYQLGGETYSYQTVPQWIEVRPAPSLDIHYELPASNAPCQEFDIKATITNNGYGAARNLRYNSLQPTTDDPSTSFSLVSARVGGIPQPDPMNIVLGDLGPGETRTIIWRIRASKPVYLLAISAGLTQVGELEQQIPAINSVTASMKPGACLMPAIPDESTYCSDACGIPSSATGYEGDPVNTRTGGLYYPVARLSIPTSAGPLSFRATYISLTASHNASGLGYGWTHNQDIRLIFPEDPEGRPGFILFKDASGNRYLFFDNGDNTYAPYPGTLGNLVKNGSGYTLTDTAENTFTFAANGALQSKTDAHGRALTYSYLANGKLEQVLSPGDNRALQFAYNANGNLESVSDHTGRGISFAYDAQDNLTAFTDLRGYEWTFEYDGEHQLTRALDPDAKTIVRNEYSAPGRVGKQFDGNGNLLIELIPQSDGSVQIVDALGEARIHSYNLLGTLVGEQDVSQAATGKIYDRNFRPTTVTDALGNPTNLTWSADGANLTSFTDAAGNSTTITYAGNKPQTITGPDNVQTTYTYDGDLLTSVTTAGKTTIYTYYTQAPHQGLVETVRDPGGQVTKYEYDTHGQQTKIIANYDPDRGENEAGLYNLTTQYEYDELGRVTKIFTPSGKTDPTWLVSYNEYDNAGNLLLSVRNYDPDSPQNHQDTYNLTTRYSYDVRGRQIAVQDTYGSITRTYFDNANRVVAVVRNLALDGRTAEAAIADETIPARGSAGTGMNLRSDHYYDDAGNLIATQDERGSITRTYNDRANRTVTSMQNLQGQDVYEPNIPTYDPLRPDENVITRSISDANGNVIAIIDNSDLITRTYYDKLNRPKRFVQNLVGQGIQVPWLDNSACGSVDENLCTDTFYDVSGNMIATKDPLGIITRTYYDQLNRPIRVVQNLVGQSYEVNWLEDESCGQADANGNVSINICTDTEYDDAGRVIATQDVPGQITRTYYDAAGRVSIVVRNLTGYDVENDTPPARALGAADENIRTDTQYDTAGRRSLTTDPLGHQVQYEYDLLGRLWKTIVNPWPEQSQNYQGPVSGEYYNLITTYTYDALGRTLTTTDTAGNLSQSEYDPQSGLLLSSNRNDLQTHYHYDPFGRQIAVTDAQGSITRSYVDGLGRTVDTVRNLSAWEITNPVPPAGQTSSESNLRTSVVYGPNGQVQETIAVDGIVTAYGYDVLGRQTSVKIPLVPASRSVYDGLGRLITSIAPSSDPDQPEVVTRYEYDAQGRLTDVWENYRPTYNPDAETNVHTQYTYDASGNRLTIRDGNGHLTTFTYDKLGRLLTETDALEHTWEYSYDKNSNRTALLDANGATTNYEYDSLGRLVGIDYPDPDADVAFEYDFLGRRTEMQDGLGTTSWAGYNDLNQPTAITDPFENTVTYAYDDFGKRSGLTYPGSGMAVSYGFDQAQRPNLVSQDQSPVAEYVYDMLGRLKNTALANGVTSTYTYTEAGQLESIVHAKGEQELASYHYEYYDNGNRKQAVELVSGSGAATGPTVQVTVVDTSGVPLAGKNIYAFNGSTYTNYNRVTDAQGQASITLPEGTYRFRVDVDGTQFWSGAENHCEVGQCGSVEFSIPQPVLVSVTNSSGAPQAGLKVYAFNGSTYTNFSATTDANGQVSLRLPLGNYRFRADFNGTQFWSGPENHCSVPGCTMASVQVTVPVTVLVRDNLSTPKAGIKVYAFNGSTYTNFSATTNEDGLAIFTLPQGSYRFRADFNGTQFWSGAANHCDVPDCEGTSVTVTRPVQVTVTDTDGAPKSGLKVYAFNGTTYTNFSATTDVAGQVNFTLPQGNYRFRADLNGTQFWSAAANHCEVPGCENAEVAVSIPLVVSIQDGDGNPQTGVKVYAFNGTTYTNYNATSNPAGNATFSLPLGNYRFRADFNGVQYWSAASNHCTVPGCNSLALIVGPQATATPTSVATQTPTPTIPAATGTPEATLTETSAPQASPTSFATETSQPETPTPVSWLPGGAKVFAVSRPQQDQTNQVIITVLDTNDAPKAGLKVYAFNGTTYVGLSGTTNDEGQVTLTVPDGEYRFRADFGGTQFWSAAENHCSVPNCPTASITVTVPLTLTVQDTDGTASAGLKVYAFNGATYSNFSATTDGDGQAVFILPQGDYRFRADFNGTQFWSAEANHCAIPDCASAAITVSKPVTVTVVGKNGQLYPNLRIYAFTGSTYTGYSGTTDASGNATFTLPLGEYRFRTDYDGVQFWSSDVNACPIPGCEAASVTLPGGTGEMSVTIDYEYDPLNRLTKASYSDPTNPEAGGRVYEYTYDAVGNRLSQTINVDGLSATTNYLYDDANRLLEAGGLAYTYDNNGNLLSDGVNTYAYDTANRLVSVTSGQDSVTSYQYNGLGDRLTETVNGVTTTFTMDLNTDLTQALSDGTHDYLYGVGRIAQLDTGTLDTEYFLGDALGSVRQLTDSSGAVTLARTYDPYGTVNTTSGTGSSGYGFTGEYQSGDSLYLRSRFYTPSTGRFLTRDTWSGDANRPLSLNRWGYVEANPINYADPSGMIAASEATQADAITQRLLTNYGVTVKKDWGVVTTYKFQPTWPFFAPCANWEPGRWTLIELEIVEEGVSDLNLALQGQINKFIGNVDVMLTDKACGRGCVPLWGHSIKFLDAGNPPTSISVRGGGNIDKWTVVHEFGHAWDRNYGWRLASKLEDYTGGHTGNFFTARPKNCDPENRLPGCNDAMYFFKEVPPAGSDRGFNRTEDFAESVTAYVYPNVAQLSVAPYNNDPTYGNILYYSDYTKTKRYAFIDSLVNGTIIP